TGLSGKAKEIRAIHEYDNSALVYYLPDDKIARLKEYFPDRWADLYGLSVMRLMDSVPLKSIKERWEKLYMP
ncbi:MAG: hypothetical protein M0T81_09605, partial [Thermoplasmatales archaeon]|nr:hypothetical protein [Thermoplasmatales archaeon]